jgi:hypothetical protein
MNIAYESSNGNRTLGHKTTGNHFNHIWAHSTMTIHEQEDEENSRARARDMQYSIKFPMAKELLIHLHPYSTDMQIFT